MAKTDKNHRVKITRESFEEGASALADQARAVASGLGDHAALAVTELVADRRQQSASELADLAEALRERGEQMEDSVIAPIINKAAEHIDRASEFIMDATAQDVLTSTKRFARSQPAWFLGGAFAIGFAAARFLKSTAKVDDDEGSEIIEPPPRRRTARKSVHQ